MRFFDVIRLLALSSAKDRKECVRAPPRCSIIALSLSHFSHRQMSAPSPQPAAQVSITTLDYLSSIPNLKQAMEDGISAIYHDQTNSTLDFHIAEILPTVQVGRNTFSWSLFAVLSGYCTVRQLPRSLAQALHPPFWWGVAEAMGAKCSELSPCRAKCAVCRLHSHATSPFCDLT